MTMTDEVWMKRKRRLQTEQEWRSCEYLYPLIRLLDPDLVEARKLRLFTTACVRHLCGDPNLGEDGWVVEALEHQADAPPTPDEVRRVAAALREVRLRCTAVMGGMYWQASVDYKEEPETDPWRVAMSTAEAVIIAAGWRARRDAGLMDQRPEGEDYATEERSVCELTRCIFGNPFRPVAFLPEWRTITAVALANLMYESRDFGTMPILADALQDAGCENEDILSHCRDADQVHVRGCWAVDLVLGKE
jgi:hypothetical protein